MWARRALLQAVVVVALAAGTAHAGRGLLFVGKGASMMHQAVAVAQPISLTPIYPQNVIMAPVYTNPAVYPGAVYPGGAAGYPQQAPYPQQQQQQAPEPAQEEEDHEPLRNVMIDTITRFIEGKKGRSSSAAAAAASASSSAAAAEKTYDEPESTSYARVRDAAAGEALPTLKIDFVRPAPAAPASARASVSNASAPAWKALFGGGGGEGEKTLTLPAVDVTLPDKAGLLSSLSRRVSDAVSAANDEAEFHKQTLRDGLTGALRSFRAKPEQAAPAAAMAAAAPLVIQPVPQTTIVPVISTSTIMPSYYTHKKPLFGKGAGALGGYGGYGKK